MNDLQGQQFRVLKPILYKNPNSKLCRTVVMPGDVSSLDFPHLPDEDIELLLRLGYIGPVHDLELEENSIGDDNGENS